MSTAPGILKLVSVTVLMPITRAGSNISRRPRCQTRRLARRRSRGHFPAERRESPSASADISEFRAQARPQPSAQPRLSDLTWNSQNAGFAPIQAGGRTMGREGRLRVEPELETPIYRPTQARTPHFVSPQNARRNVAGPANGARCADTFAYSSQRLFVGKDTVTDRNFLSDHRILHN